MADGDQRQARRERARSAATGQAGLLTRTQLAALGVNPAVVRAEVLAGRWALAAREVISVATVGSVDETDAWVGVLAAAPRSSAVARAALAGLSALRLAGLSGIGGDGLVHVAAPKSSRPLPLPVGYRLHETRRWRDDDVLSPGIPRFRPEVATIQAALWARTDREAALMLCAPVQQRLTRAQDALVVLERIRRDRRRAFLRATLADVAGGSQAIGELDLVRLCRARGLPAPDRQQILRRPGGSYYLDARWTRWGVVAEVDGVGHLMVDQWLADCVRHNQIAIDDEVVLRLPTVGLRLEPDVHLSAVRSALLARGWRP
jgi:hypothetical protein